MADGSQHSLLSRRAAIGAGLAAGCLPPLRAAPSTTLQSGMALPPPVPADTWAMLGDWARRTVAAESPPSAFPFVPGRTGADGTLVIAHYFPFFPITIGGATADKDYYANNFLRADGENGKWARVGGYLRDRPLPDPVPPPSPHKAANLALEVARAVRIGVDAFAVDLLGIGQGPQWLAAVQMLDAAQAVSPAFRIIPEPDMAFLTAAVLSLGQLADGLQVFARHPASYKLRDGRMLVMPFAAEHRPPDFWQALIDEMARRGTPIAFAPVFLAPATGAYARVSWAQSLWGDRDVGAGARATAVAASAAAAGVSRFIYPVAPQDYRPKSNSFWEARGSDAYRAQWEAAIASGQKAVQIITWNDYSESSQVAPSGVTQFLFYDLAAYYIAWMKRGSPPPILRDALYCFHRRQIADPAVGPGGPAMRQVGRTRLNNDVQLVALLTAPGELSLTSGGNRQVERVGAGLQTIEVAAAPGTPAFALARGGRTVLAGRSGWAIDPSPARKDFTYGGSATTRPFVAAPGLG